jgi:CHAT domain-containing protein
MRIFLVGAIYLLFVFAGSSPMGFAQSDDVNRERTYINGLIAKGSISEAIAYVEGEAVAAENAKRWDRASLMYTEAAQTAGFAGQLQKALGHANKANEAAIAGKNPYFRAGAIGAIVGALQRLGKYEDVRRWLLLRLEIVPQIQHPEWRRGSEAGAHAALGQDFMRTREFEKAIEHLSYSVQVREGIVSFLQRIGANIHLPVNRNFLANQMNGLGEAYLRAGRLDEAIQNYERSLTISERYNLRSSGYGSTHLGLGRVYLQKKDYARAQQYFEKAFELATKLRLSGGLVSASIQLGNLSLLNAKPSEAIDFYKRAVANIESSRSQIQSEELRRSYFENQGQAYTGIIRAALSANKSDDAFDYNERARSRAFLDTLGTKVRLVKSEALVAEETLLQSRITSLRIRLAIQESDESVTAQLRGELEDAEKAYADFVSKIRKENKEQASLMNVEPLTVKQVQEMLDPGVALLEYFVTNDAVMLWVVEKDKLTSVSIPLRREQLQSQVTTYREAITELAEKEKFETLAQELYKLLIQPTLPHIRGKELLIIPHDVLHYLPFQALLSPSGKYLIEDYPINYLSSASLMQFTQEKRNARGELRKVLADGGKVLTFGNPDLDDPKMALQFAGIEAKEIKSLYPQSAIYLEKEATEEKAKALVGNSDIIHFASHAELNEDDPLASAIRLTKSDKEDGRLEVREIFGMDLKASLVVLSACETGLGKLSSGDELVGLTRAFIYAGTPSVVASLWNVEDSSTAQLMASFYKNLKTMTKVEALRQAQLNLIRGNINSDLLARRGIGGVGKLGEVPAAKPSSDANSNSPLASVSTSHPFFWAPFILVGEGK